MQIYIYTSTYICKHMYIVYTYLYLYICVYICLHIHIIYITHTRRHGDHTKRQRTGR